LGFPHYFNGWIGMENLANMMWNSKTTTNTLLLTTINHKLAQLLTTINHY